MGSFAAIVSYVPLNLHFANVPLTLSWEIYNLGRLTVMINKMYRVLAVLCMVLVLPVFVSAELQGPKPLGKDSNPTKTVGSQPPANAKLNLINNLRHGLKMPLTQSVPPAKVILTPKAPVSGANYIAVQGLYTPLFTFFSLRNNYQLGMTERDHVSVGLVTVSGKTYLLDVLINGATGWTIWTTAPYANLNAQQGHIFIVFIASSDFIAFSLAPTDNNGAFDGKWHSVYSAELTQIN
jgi:hypothetical protein